MVCYSYKLNCFPFEYILKCNVFLKLNFSASVSHDPSGILSSILTVVLLNTVCGNHRLFFSFISFFPENSFFVTSYMSLLSLVVSLMHS